MLLTAVRDLLRKAGRNYELRARGNRFFALFSVDYRTRADEHVGKCLDALGTLVTSCALVIPGMIYSEVSLAYLGIINLSTGNTTSVGTIIEAGQRAMQTAPHIVIFPSVFLILLMLSFNLFGNGLRDAFNPSLRGSEG